MGTVTYDRPREKMQKKGPASLSTAELLQVLIGSGNAQASVARIAKRTLRLLSRHGSDIAFEQLKGVKGLGVARISQIMAAFELASRYPLGARQAMLDSRERIIEQLDDVRQSADHRVCYITLDGARRMIARRSVRVDAEMSHSRLIRRICVDAIADRAESLIVGSGAADYSSVPSMTDLNLARDLRLAEGLLNVKLADYLLLNGQGASSLRGYEQ